MKTNKLIRTAVHRTAQFLAAMCLLCVATLCLTSGEDGMALAAPAAVASIPVGANKRLVAFAEKKTKLIAKMEKLLDEADGDLDEEQEKQYSALEEELQAIEKKYDREVKLSESKSTQQHRTFTGANDAADEPDLAGVRNTKPAWEDDPKCGFKSHRDFLMSVIETPKKGEVTDDRLKFLATAGSDEQSTQADPYGGFFLPEGLAPGVLEVGSDGDPTVPTQIPMQTMSLKFNARTDKNHSTSVSGGLTVGRNIETQSPDSSRMKFDQVTLEVSEQSGVAYATELLLAQSPVSFIALLDQGFNQEAATQTLRDKLRGTGAGEPLGIFNAPCAITIDAESGPQTADTIVGANIQKMRARQWNYSRSIWMANHDTLLQLMAAHISGTNTDNFLFAPGNGSDVPDTLLGRPIFFNEHCSTLGDKGDLINVDWSQYLWGTLGSPNLNRAESMHVRFLQSERTLKFWRYNDGKPWWNVPLTPAQSTTTLSPVIILGARTGS